MQCPDLIIGEMTEPIPRDATHQRELAAAEGLAGSHELRELLEGIAGSNPQIGSTALMALEFCPVAFGANRSRQISTLAVGLAGTRK